jgi:uncharacterized protein with von Willebrand factor type A (vWA) domain
MIASLPRAVEPFMRFATLLRENRFAVAPEQLTNFLEAVELLGPKGIGDIRKAAHAMLAPAPERRAAFDLLFDHVFLGQEVEGEVASEAEEEFRQSEDEGGVVPPDSGEENLSGEAATAAEVLSARRFAVSDDNETLRRFSRAAPAALPRRRGYRRRQSRSGDTPDFRRMLRHAARNDGDVPRLFARTRKTRQRAILLLIDVSGSMKGRTEAHLRFAHSLARVSDRLETFTFGTRLTRLTRALRLRNVDQALSAAANAVSDFDGGTRIGEALQAFLAVPRFAGFARGSVTIVLSDGLERGDPDAMIDAVHKLSRRSWKLSWLTPLAANPGYRPQTRGLSAVLPFLDDLSDGSSVEALCQHVLMLARRAA